MIRPAGHTAIVFDPDLVPIAGVPLSFRAKDSDGQPVGEISASTVTTDEYGVGEAIFSAGDEKENQFVTIEVDVVSGLELDSHALVPVQIVGTTVELDMGMKTLECKQECSGPAGGIETQLAIFISDGGGQPIHNAPVTIAVMDEDGEPSPIIGVEPMSGPADQGEMTATITGLSEGIARVRVESLRVHSMTLPYRLQDRCDLPDSPFN